MALTQQLNMSGQVVSTILPSTAFLSPKWLPGLQKSHLYSRQDVGKLVAFNPAVPFLRKPKAFPEHSEQTFIYAYSTDCILWTSLDAKETGKTNS